MTATTGATADEGGEERHAGAPAFGDVLAARRVVFFCGKGGVGKTTLAAAVALARAGAGGGPVALLGADPAAALPRVLGAPVTEAPVALAPGVEARQVSGDALLARFRAEHGAALAEVIEGGTYLEREDAEALAAASLPGVDEVLGLLELADVARGAARLVVVDTAPSAHALRLLALPEAFEAAIAVLEAMREKARAVEEALAGRARESAGDRLIAGLSERIARLRALLEDAAAAGFVAVATSDAGDVAEAGRLAEGLGRVGLGPVAVVVNGAEVPAPAEAVRCERCARRARDAQAAASALGARFAGVPVFLVPRVEPAPIGLAALRALGERLLGAVAVAAPPPPQTNGFHSSTPPSPANPGQTNGFHSSTPVPVEWAEGALAALAGRSLVLAGGKGGVGKTTVAAALAVAAAAADPRKRVLLASLAGSGLADTLGAAVSDEPSTPFAELPNLSALELDAPARFERLKAAFREDVERALDELIGGRSLDLRYDRAVVRGLLDLAPPGVDEIAALALLEEALGGADTGADTGAGAGEGAGAGTGTGTGTGTGAWDAVVLDTAPTGHLVRFLEMPRVAREWLGIALRLLGRYPELGGGGAVERTVGLLRRVRAVAERLADPARTALVVVALPERIPAEEAASLRERAAAAGVRPRLFVLNRVPRPTGCARCDGRRAAGLEAARELLAAAAPAPLACVREADAPPRGLAGLGALDFAGPEAIAA